MLARQAGIVHEVAKANLFHPICVGDYSCRLGFARSSLMRPLLLRIFFNIRAVPSGTPVQQVALAAAEMTVPSDLLARILLRLYVVNLLD